MAEHDRQVWERMLAFLRSRHAPICRQWFDEIEPLGLDGGTLKLRAHTLVHRDYLRRQCSEAFNDAARSVSGMLLTVEFLGPDDRAQAPADVPAAIPVEVNGAPPAEPKPRIRFGPSGPREAERGLVLNPDYSFDQFVTGPENRLAHSAAIAIAANPGRAYNPFFIHGDVGLGKTHLLQAICLKVRESNPEASIYYTSCEGFLNEFMAAVQAGEMSQFRHRFRDVDILAIDDIQFLTRGDRSQEEFFHTFNALYQSHKQIVLSSDAPPEDIPDLEERLVSRFKWGLVASIDRPAYETRVGILKKKAALRGIELSDGVAQFLASKIETNIRELEGTVIKLQVMSAVEGRPVDIDLARAALGDEPPRVERQVQVQHIIDAVTDYYGVKVTDLLSKRRQRSIALPRQLCMYLARRYTRFSLEEIGLKLGGRDHTTVMHAVKIIEIRRNTDDEFGDVVRSLEDSLKGAAAATSQ